MLALRFALLLLVTGEFAVVSGDGPDCDVKNAGTCYKIIVNNALGTNYTKATSSCNDLGYEIAQIPNRTVQTEIMTFLRQKMTEINRKNWVRAWIGTTINAAGVVTPHITDGQWYTMFPMKGLLSFPWTNILLHVNPDSATKYQGLINTYPRYKTNGVVCQFVPLLCPVIYENKGFIAAMDREVNYDGGVAVCKSRGGHLANIYSQTHMDDVMKYIRENRMDGSSMKEFRLGLKYDPKANKLSLRDGTNGPAGLKWYPTFPWTVEDEVPDYTTVTLGVNSDQSSTQQYLSNTSRSGEYYVICEIE